jgi:uncharacterized protein (TIGR02594 family)
MSTKTKWLLEAEKYIGTQEISGPHNNPKVVQFWEEIHLGGINDDETPWCAAFVGAVLEEAGIKSSRSGMAKSYLNWGTGLKKPVQGCIVVFTRKGGGHVGFVEGVDKNGNLYVLGGNQSDAVNIKLFTTNNVVGYRWPEGEPVSEELPVMTAAADFETKVV